MAVTICVHVYRSLRGRWVGVMGVAVTCMCHNPLESYCYWASLVAMVTVLIDHCFHIALIIIIESQINDVCKLIRAFCDDLWKSVTPVCD